MTLNKISSSFLGLLPNHRNIVRTKFMLSFTGRNRPLPISMAYNSFERTDIGTGAAPLIVLHELFASKSQWNSVCKAIHEKTNPHRKVITVDMRNHGESPHSPYHTYEHIVEDIVGFTKENNIEKASLLGHSMGGRVVMYTALKYPNMVDQIIVVDISPFTTPRKFLQLETAFPMLKSIIIPNILSMDEGRENVKRHLKKETDNQDMLDYAMLNLKKTDSGRFIWGQNINSLHTNFRHIAHFPIENLNDLQYRGPSLFIGGSKSDYLKFSDFDEIKRFFPKAEMQFIDSGHHVHSEYPTQFAKAVVEFLNNKDL